MPNREDSVLDEIDRLVDQSLSRGDRSDSYHGTQWRQDIPCPWCREGWHFLPITERMEAMRGGSYGTDEFGYGIVDPEYRLRDDDSAVVCPGSEYHGPQHFTRQWDKQRRERMEAGQSDRLARRVSSPDPLPYLPPGQRRRLRFIGPFEPWTIALDDERDMEDIVSNPAVVGLPGPIRRHTLVRSHRLTATFELNDPIRNPSPEFLRENRYQFETLEITPGGTSVTMNPIEVPFAEFVVHATDPTAPFPEYVEFVTTYSIERHPWFMPYWQVEEPSVQGHESDYVIIDEAHEFRDNDLREYVNNVQAVIRHYASEASIPPQEADRLLYGGQEVFRRGEENSQG